MKNYNKNILISENGNDHLPSASCQAKSFDGYTAGRFCFNFTT